jgi:hypothetical protein
MEPIKPVDEKYLENIKQRIMDAKSKFDIDDILTNEDIFSAEAKTVFLCGLFKLSIPKEANGNTSPFAGYDAVLEYLWKKDFTT